MTKEIPKRSQYPVGAPSAKKPPQRPVYDFQAPGVQTGRTKPASRLVYDYKQEEAKRCPMPRVPETPLVTSVQQTAPPQPARKSERPLFDQKQAMAPDQTVRQNKGMRQMVLPLGTVQVQTPPQRQAPQSTAQEAEATAKKARPQQAKTVKKQAKKPLTYGEARRRRRNRNLLAACAVVLVLSIGIVLSFTVLFKIKTIEITGDLPYTQEEMLAAFGRKAGDNLFSFKAQNTQQAMTAALPYLESVTVNRRLPDKVELVATAAVETYMLNSNAGWLVLSASFKVLRIEAQPPTGLVLVLGADAENPATGAPLALTDAEKQQALRTLTQTIGAQGFPSISEIDITNALELSFLYDNRIRVLLGTVNELDAKIDWAKYLCLPGTGEESRAATDRGTLDVSSRNAEGRLKAGWTAGKL